MQVILDNNGGFLSATLRRPSNFHAHLRQGALMQAIAKHLMRHVMYLLLMPNNGPIRTIREALIYYDEAMEIARHEGFEQLRLVMTLYHTDEVSPRTIEQMARSAIKMAVKHYPTEPGVTTNSGVEGAMPIEESDYQLSAMEDWRVNFLVHCESTHDKYGVKLHPRDGARVFIKEKMWRMRDKHPRLRICVEHASTIEEIDFVKADTSGNTAMTITPHHPNFNEHDLEEHGPGFKCKTILNTPEDQAAITEFMVSGDPRAIAGDDSAAHLSRTKLIEFEKAANGCFWKAEQAIPFYAHAFIKAGAMDDRFEQFMSLNGPRWWDLPEPDKDDTITIVKSENDMSGPIEVPEEHDRVLPLGWDADPAKQVHIGLAIQ